jgi:hypothetical protein
MPADSEQPRGGRARFGRWAGELLVIFVGVSAAFVVDNYRDNRNQTAEFHQALSGVTAELNRHESRSREFADGISARIKEWEEADRVGKQAIPGYYRIPGATHPPIAAWNTMVSSGLARLIEPKLRTELGYFYSEFTGIHDNYDRYNQFTEREVLPRLAAGPNAFYGPDGRILAMFRVHMDFEQEFANDLRNLSTKAHELRTRLENIH